MKKKKVVIEIDSEWFDLVNDAIRLIKRISKDNKIPVNIKIEEKEVE